MSRLKIVSGLLYKIVIESWNTHASSSSQEAPWTSVEGCCSRIEREARNIAECTSYTLCVLLSFFFGGWKEKPERSQSVPLALPASYSLFLRRIGSMEIEKFIIRKPPTGEKDDYDSENSWISDGLPSSSRRRRRGGGRWEVGEWREK